MELQPPGCRDHQVGAARLVAAGVGLTGNQQGRWFLLRPAAERIQDAVHHPARRPYTQPNCRDHRREKHQGCH